MEAYEFYADPANRELGGPPRKRRKPLRTEILHVRIDPDTLKRVSQIADAWDITVSDWVRAAIRREEYRQRVKWMEESHT
jgi:hypothetical protein